MDGKEISCGFDLFNFHPPRALLGAMGDGHNDISGKLDHQVSTTKDLNPHLAGWGVPWLSLF